MICLKSKLAYILRSWFIFILCLLLVICALFFKVKPIVALAAVNKGKMILLSAADNAVLQIMETQKLTYDDIAVISRDDEGNIKGIEIDSFTANLIKSSISKTVGELATDSQYYSTDIHIGTLIGSEFTSGIGPKMNFKFQIAPICVVNFESRFESAGINQTLHRIILHIDMSASVLLRGFTESFSVSTTAIVAQTVIVGAVPESFTNVEEDDGEDIADEIFNFTQ